MRIEITREIAGNRIEYRATADEPLDELGKRTFIIDDLKILFGWLKETRELCRTFGKGFAVVRKPTQRRLF